MTHVLGVSAFYHDAAAAIVRDGVLVAAAEEERFTRRKHDARFPSNAISYCLEETCIEPDELGAVVFYDNPLLTMDRVITSLAASQWIEPPLVDRPDHGIEAWRRAASTTINRKLDLAGTLEATLHCLPPLYVSSHHKSHAASAFYPSPFDDAAVLTIDGVGEWATTTIGRGHDGTVEILDELHFPHSLGLLYTAFTVYCGFAANDGEYKLMGLAPYGEPRYVDLIRSSLIEIRADGSFVIDLSRFEFMASTSMIGPAFEDLFGGPPRDAGADLTEREADLASSIQAVAEEVVLGLARRARESTGARNLVMAGGVALNCVANGKIARAGVFDDIWVQPAAGDSGGAVGAALLGSHELFGEPRPALAAGARDRMAGARLGPGYSTDEAQAFLDRHAYPYTRVEDRAERAALIADALEAGQVVGLVDDRMEFGPRALGGRSILADARVEDMQQRLNDMKRREGFRPFAPAVLAESASSWFDLDLASPYMSFVAPVTAARRGTIPAVTHVDGTARVQTVDADGTMLRAVLEAFEKSTGVPLVVNTSFNMRGEPIVCTPLHAYRCFIALGLDLLVLADCVLHKAKQPKPSIELLIGGLM